MSDANINYITHHPLLDSIVTPFNRIDITSQFSIILPSSSYEVTDTSKGATLLLVEGPTVYAIPVNVFTTLPPELLKCINVPMFGFLIAQRVSARFKALGLEISAFGIRNMVCMQGALHG